MRITAAVVRAPLAPFTIEELELDEPRADEVIVNISGVGLCHTDLVAVAGGLPLQLPAVFGHEGAGIIEKIGSAVTKVKVGDPVVLSFLSCGHCFSCAQRKPSYCQSMHRLNVAGTRSDGSSTLKSEEQVIAGSFFGQSSFATYALANEANVVKLPSDVPVELMGPLGCGVQTGAGAVMNALACEANSTILILGGGAVGLSAAMAAVVRGCSTIIVVELQELRRNMALELGATHVIDPHGSDIVAAVRAIAPDGVNYVFETTGLPTVMEAGVACMAPQATFGFVGIPPADSMQMKLPGTLWQTMEKGLVFRGIIEGDSDPDHFIPQLVELYRAGRFPFDRLLTIYRLQDINQAIADQHKGLCIKPVLLPDSLRFQSMPDFREHKQSLAF